ncbi:MAG: outer membrane beta-barrel protein [Candidatus Aminicenantes bacterium]|nr:outer membrane beta-barrel protein [Candidatus Aminicenantes bacterium]
MKKILVIILSISVLSGMVMGRQILQLKVGLFQPSLDSDLWEINMENLALGKQDMLELFYGAEYEFFINNILSLSLEGGLYQKTIYSQYRDWEYEDGTPIYQNLSLRITSLEVNVKLYPIGYKKLIFPFVGAGVGIYGWRYEQWGDFINFEDLTVQEGYAETSTYTAGFNGKAGIGFRFGPFFGLFLEAKYQYLKGQLSSFFEGFGKLDLSGFKYNLGFCFFFR